MSEATEPEAATGRSGCSVVTFSMALLAAAAAVGISTYNHSSRSKIEGECRLGDVQVHDRAAWARYQKEFADISLTPDARSRWEQRAARRKALGYRVVRRLAVKTPSFGPVYRTMSVISPRGEIARFTYRHFYGFSLLEFVGIAANVPDYTCPGPPSAEAQRVSNYFL